MFEYIKSEVYDFIVELDDGVYRNDELVDYFREWTNSNHIYYDGIDFINNYRYDMVEISDNLVYEFYGIDFIDVLKNPTLIPVIVIMFIGSDYLYQLLPDEITINDNIKDDLVGRLVYL